MSWVEKRLILWHKTNIRAPATHFQISNLSSMTFTSDWVRNGHEEQQSWLKINKVSLSSNRILSVDLLIPIILSCASNLRRNDTSQTLICEMSVELSQKILILYTDRWRNVRNKLKMLKSQNFQNEISLQFVTTFNGLTWAKIVNICRDFQDVKRFVSLRFLHNFRSPQEFKL